MKKTLAKIVLGASLAVITSCPPHFTLAQNVGEAMPSLEGTLVMNVIPGQKLGKGWIIHHVHKVGNCYANVVYAICGDKTSKKPVGFFEFETGKLYLDNAQNDGIIDSVVTQPPYPTIEQTVPFCKHAS